MKFDWLLLFHIHFDALKKGCDLEQKMVPFVNKSTVEGQSDCSYFKMGVIKCRTQPFLSKSGFRLFP